MLRPGDDLGTHHPEVWDFPERGFRVAVCSECPYVAVELDRPCLTAIDGGAG